MNENERIIAQKKLPGESKYDVCYECLDRTGKNYKDIQPMFYVTTLEERDITTPDGETFKKRFMTITISALCVKKVLLLMTSASATQ